MQGELQMSKGRVFQMVGVATAKLREPKHLHVPIVRRQKTTVMITDKKTRLK